MDLIGRVNEANIFICKIQVMALINTGAQVSTITQDFCEKYGYDMHPLKEMLHLEGMGGFSIHYWGHIEAIIRIPLIKDYEQYVPMLVLKSLSPFSSWVPVKLDNKIMVEELAHASSMWHQTYMSTMVTDGATGTIKQGGQETPFINTPLVTMKSIVIPSLGVQEWRDWYSCYLFVVVGCKWLQNQ